VATLEERMMIMGLCLQGILANPTLSDHATLDAFGPQGAAIKRAELVHLAHQYADKLLNPPPQDTVVQKVVSLTRIAYEALRAVGPDVVGGEAWPPYAEAAAGRRDDALMRVQGLVADALSGVASPTFVGRIVAAVVLASQPEAEEPEPDLFDGQAHNLHPA